MSYMQQAHTFLFSISQDRIDSLQQLRTISDIVVAAVLTMAIELVIAWNHISDVQDINTAAQLIPPVVSGAFVLRSVIAWMSEPPLEQSHLLEFPLFPSGSVYTSTSGGSHRRRRNTVYIGSSRDWTGRQRRTSHRHHHGSHRRRARESAYVVDPSYIPYSAAGFPASNVYPQMYAAGAFQGPPEAAAAHGRHATFAGDADDIYAADDSGGAARSGHAVCLIQLEIVTSRSHLATGTDRASSYRIGEWKRLRKQATNGQRAHRCMICCLSI